MSRAIPKKSIFVLLAMFPSLAFGQLAVTVSPPKVTGQKAIVELAMTNNLSDTVASARAICFLVDERGKIIGQSTKWVIGGTKDRPILESKKATMFNFVITSQQAFATNNLKARVNFDRLILAGGKSANPEKTVVIQATEKSKN